VPWQVLVATGHRTSLSCGTQNCSTKDEDMTSAHSGSEAGADDDSMQQSDSEEYENGSDGGDEEEEGEDDYDRDMMIEIGTKQSLWERVEQLKDQPLDSNAQKSEELSAIQNAVAERQIFNTREAFQMLTRELSDIIRAQDPERFADAVDGNVYCWDVHLGGFASSSLLAQVGTRAPRCLHLWCGGTGSLQPPWCCRRAGVPCTLWKAPQFCWGPCAVSQGGSTTAACCPPACTCCGELWLGRRDLCACAHTAWQPAHLTVHHPLNNALCAVNCCAVVCVLQRNVAPFPKLRWLTSTRVARSHAPCRGRCCTHRAVARCCCCCCCCR
jgi:hypothetical protein